MASLKPKDLDIIGDTGLLREGGHIFEERLPRLQGVEGVRNFREMADNSATAGTVLFTFEALFRQVIWRLEPANDSPEALEWADFIETCRHDMSHTWADMISEILTFMIYGWSYLEIVPKVRKGQTNDPRTRSKFNDGKVGWRMIPLRGQETLNEWDFDDDGGIRGMWQDRQDNNEKVFLPIENCLLFRVRANRNNPEGRSLFRNAFRSWWFVKRLQEIEAIGAERDLSGLPVMELPLEVLASKPGADEARIRSMMETMIQQIRRGEREGALVPTELDREGKPTGFKFRLMSSAGKRQFPINEIIQRYEKRILQSVLMEFTMLGMESTGSFALASVKTEIANKAMASLLDNIASVFNRFAITRLMKMNDAPLELSPVLKFSEISTPPLEAISTYVSKLAGVGALTIEPAMERKLREIAHLPQSEVPLISSQQQARLLQLDGEEELAEEEPEVEETEPEEDDNP